MRVAVRLHCIGILLVLALFSGCSGRGVLVFLSEPYSVSLGAKGSFQRDLSAAVSARGYRLTLVAAPSAEQPENRLAEELGRGRTAVAVIDPLFSREAGRLAPGYPGVAFVLTGGEEGTDASGNVKRLVFDRSAAFQTAGYASVMSLKAKSGGESAPGIGILLPHSRAVGDAAASAFIKGCLEAGGAAPLVKELEDPLDKAAVTRAVEELRKQNVEIVLPRLGELNAACLAALRTSGGSAVTEDWKGTGAFADQVFLSIEEDVIGGIAACLDPSAAGASSIPGPVEVVWGSARSIPEGLEGKIRKQ